MTFSPVVQQQFASIEPTIAGSGDYRYPCSVDLKDGSQIDCVYVVGTSVFTGCAGLAHPSERPVYKWIQPDSIVTIQESPYRLPPRFAEEIYRAGESGMDYWVFTVVFSRWSKREYLTSTVDFIDYPSGKGPKDVKAVRPHVGRRLTKLKSHLIVYWCVLSDEAMSQWRNQKPVA
jgi:hypothetical protein